MTPIENAKGIAASDYINNSMPEITDGTDYSKIVSDPEFKKTGFAGIKPPENTDDYASNIHDKKNSEIPIVESDIPNRASWMELSTPSSFYYYAQEESYSCGPACVKMAIKYITGVAYAESSIRAGCNTDASGTSLSDMCTYINGMQNSNNYIISNYVNKNTMASNLYSGIVQYDAPPIICIYESQTQGWPFNLGGHAVTIYAAKSDLSAFMVADPWGGYDNPNSSYKWYSRTVDELYDAYSAIYYGYMY